MYKTDNLASYYINQYLHNNEPSHTGATMNYLKLSTDKPNEAIYYSLKTTSNVNIS